MNFDLPHFSIAYISLLLAALCFFSSAQIESDAFWFLIGGVGFLGLILLLAVVVRVLLAGGGAGSRALVITIIILKLPILVLVTYKASNAGSVASKSFILGVLIFIPALLLSSLARYVISSTYRS